ncbi:transcriptional regulator [Granulicoccus phenolivorans]|uniref:transcriptional regulator n=1 Tax=Granulicoccus phenolivorans TaxID=266854 RepID=UPI00040CD113|nr:transcriptional regulator [Granulicoccus phenolivorans]
MAEPTGTAPEYASDMPEDVLAALQSPLDHVLSDAVRLRIQAALVGLPVGGGMRFTMLAKSLGLSDGNLGAHLSVLQEVGYVNTETTWKGKRRTRWFSASGTGRDAFAAHVSGLRSIITAADPRVTG